MAVKTFNLMSLGNAGLVNPEQVGYKDSIEIIKDESFKIQKSFVKIGWYLKHIRDDELYKEEGYSGIYECAADQLGYSQSTVSRFINICEKFSKNHNSPELDDKYTGFDKSQMIEMLPLTPEQVGRVTPDMTVKQIRNIKKEEKREQSDALPVNDDNIPGQTSIEADFPEYMPGSQQEKVPHVLEQSDREMSTESSGSDAVILKANDNILRNQNAVSEYREAACVCEEPEETTSSPNLQDTENSAMPILKNNEQRKEWLNSYRAWGLWYYDEHIDVNYYKYDFPDGSRLVVAEYPKRFAYWSDKRNDEYFYHLLEKNKKGYDKVYDEEYRHVPDSETYLTEFLKRVQKSKN